MNEAVRDGGRAEVEAGAGRPFRFSLVFEGSRGRLLTWLGTQWALGVGLAGVGLFALAGALLAAVLDLPALSPEVSVFAAAAAGALFAAHHLRPRTVQFAVLEGAWCWRELWSPARYAWSPITEKDPLRLEREVLSTVEGFTLYAGTRRLLSYLGDPTIGRSVSLAFESAGVPLRIVMKRRAEANEN